MSSESDPRIARYAALQSVTEIGIGSLLHGFRIPLGGHLLSLNQGVLLTFAVRPSADRSRALTRKGGIFVAASVSFVSALMKFLSPAGARAMPALGISLQGILYSAGIAVFGLNGVGVALGFILLSFWAFLHPVVFAYLIFGQTLFVAAIKLWTEIAAKLGIPVEFGAWALVGVVVLKGAISAGLAVFAWRSDITKESAYLSRIDGWARRGALASKRKTERMKPDAPVLGATKDLLRPIFLVSFVLSAGFVFFARQDATVGLAYLGRTVGMAWLIFFAVRAFPKAWAEKLQTRFPAFAEAAEEVRRSRT